MRINEWTIRGGTLRTFTAANLSSLSPSVSRGIALAYCSDCINSGSPTGIGGMVRWSNEANLWLTFQDNAPATTDLMAYAVQMHARGGAGLVRKGPAVSFYNNLVPWIQAFTTQSGSATDAARGVDVGLASSLGGRLAMRALTGQLGAGRTILRVSGISPVYQTTGLTTSLAGMFGTVSSGQERRSMVLVGTLNSFNQSGATAGSGDYAWRFGICTQGADMTTTPSTFIGFFYDRSNNAGWNAGTSDTVRAHVRINGTTLLDPTIPAADTLVASSNTNLAHMLMAIAVEPTGTSGNDARVRVAWLQGRGGAWQIEYDSTQSFGSGSERFLQSIAAVAVGTRTIAASTLESVWDQISHCTSFAGGSTGNQPVIPAVAIA